MTDLLERLAAENPVAVCETPSIDPVWAAIDAHGRAGGRSSRAATKVRRSFATASGVALACVAVVIAVVALSVLHVRHNAAAPESAAPRSLVSELGVLRRVQTSADDPPAVVAVAQRAVTPRRRGATRRAGVVVRALVRRLVVAPNGDRLFLAPIRLRSTGRIDLAALVLTDADDRPLAGVFPAAAVTSASIAQGAQYSIYGFSVHSSLLAQVVPDGVASVQFRFPAGARPGAGPLARSITVEAHDSVAVALQAGPLVDAWPEKIIQRNSAHETISVAPAPSTAAGHELNPASICTSIPRAHTTNPAGPAAIRNARPLAPVHLALATRQGICSQDGLPLRAYRQADGVTEFLYPGGRLILMARHYTAIGSISHMSSDGRFPVQILTTLAPAPYLTP